MLLLPLPVGVEVRDTWVEWLREGDGRAEHCNDEEEWRVGRDGLRRIDTGLIVVESRSDAVDGEAEGT